MAASDDVVGGVLCAGFGTRLRPLTEALPKPLLPFLNTPIVSYALDHLAEAGIQRVGVNLHHLADSIPPVVDPIGAQFGLQPVYSREWDILGTAGGIRGMWNALDEPDATMVVLNGDSIMNVDLGAHLQNHLESGAPATLVVRPKADDQPGGVWLDAAGRLVGLRDVRHPDAGGGLDEYDFTGVYFLEPPLLGDIPLANGGMVADVCGPLLEDGEMLNASVNADFWAALDNPELFLDTTRRVLGDVDLFDQAPLPTPCGPGLFSHGARPDDAPPDWSAPVLVGPDASVHDDAALGPNAVIDGVAVADGALVRNAVVYGMKTLEGRWEDCLAVAGEVARVDAG